MCKGCSAGRCLEAPSEAEYAELDCPACDGEGAYKGTQCGACDGVGRYRVTECFQDYSRSLVEPLNLAVLVTSSHTWPVAGGLLDQSAWFLELQQRFESECNRVDNERSKRDGT